MLLPHLDFPIFVLPLFGCVFPSDSAIHDAASVLPEHRGQVWKLDYLVFDLKPVAADGHVNFLLSYLQVDSQKPQINLEPSLQFAAEAMRVKMEVFLTQLAFLPALSFSNFELNSVLKVLFSYVFLGLWVWQTNVCVLHSVDSFQAFVSIPVQFFSEALDISLGGGFEDLRVLVSVFDL